ncbi:QsdR family transcriptional regulator [Nocardioides montaniterrae]
MSRTPLSRMLADPDPDSRPDALGAFRLARRRFLAGDRVEMQELASDLGVSRATVFRWVGSRDDLLVEIVWSISEPTFRDAIAATKHLEGGRRVAAVMGAFAEASIASPPFMAFVQREPERTLRLLTTKATWFQGRLIALIEELIRSEVEAGHLDPPLPLHDLAYITTRMTETFVYADVVAGETPDPDKVRQVVGALLRD